VGDLVPDAAHCMTLFNPIILPQQTAGLAGICSALQHGPDPAFTFCESLDTGLSGAFNGELRGSCHGWAGHDCGTIPDIINERSTCSTVQFRTLFGNMQLLGCIKVPNPPQALIMDDVTTPDVVETFVRVKDLEIGLVIDRDLNGQSTEVAALRNCFDNA